MTSRPSRACALVLASLASACAQIPAHTFNATPLAVPVPSVQSVGTLTLSNANLQAMEVPALAAAPATLDALRFPGGCDNPCFHFERRPGGSLTIRDGRLLLKNHYRGHATKKVTFGECTLDPLFIGPEIAMRPRLGKEGATWYVSVTDANVSAVREPGSDTHCVFSSALTDVSELVDKFAAKMARQMEDAIEQRKFPLPVGDLADRLRGPLEIPAPGGRRVCLYPRVTGIAFGNFVGLPLRCVDRPFCEAIYIPREEESLTSVTVPFQFTGAPTLLITSSACPAAERSLAAPLSTRPQPGPFRIAAAGGIEYAALSSIVFEQIKGVRARRGALRPAIKPTKIQIGDAQGQLFVQVDVGGALRGTVYFWGTPTLSPDKKTLSIADLHLAAESHSALLGLDVRLPDLIVNLFQGLLSRALVFDVDKIVQPIVDIGSHSLPFPGGGSLSLGRFSVTIASVRSVPSSLQVDAILEGTATGTLARVP